MTSEPGKHGARRMRSSFLFRRSWARYCPPQEENTSPQSFKAAVCRIQGDLLAEMEYNINNYVFIRE